MRRKSANVIDSRILSVLAGCAAGCLTNVAGCVPAARVNLAAADSMGLLSREVARAVEEYHRDVERGDDRNEEAAVEAFVTRIRKDAKNEAKSEKHIEEFLAALRRVREDREVESRRHAACLDNVRALNETTAGLRRVGIEALWADAEAKRFLFQMAEQAQPSKGENVKPKS